jgi:hypothetical protein
MQFVSAQLGGVAGLGAALAANRELLEAELNVKAVHELADPAGAVRTELVLDYARLGKRLRGKVKDVAAAVKRGEFRELPDGSMTPSRTMLEWSPDTATVAPRAAIENWTLNDG